MDKEERKALIREMSAAEYGLADGYLEMKRCLRAGRQDYTADTRPKVLYTSTNLRQLGIFR